jgi:hypothetical protein
MPDLVCAFLLVMMRRLYNLAIIAVIVVPMSFLPALKENNNISTLVQAFAVFWLAMSVNCLFFIPRLMTLYNCKGNLSRVEAGNGVTMSNEPHDSDICVFPTNFTLEEAKNLIVLQRKKIRMNETSAATAGSVAVDLGLGAYHLRTPGPGAHSFPSARGSNPAPTHFPDSGILVSG